MLSSCDGETDETVDTTGEVVEEKVNQEIELEDGVTTFHYDWRNDSLGDEAAYSYSGLARKAIQHDEKLSEAEDHFDVDCDMDVPKGNQVGNTFSFI